MPEKTEIHPKVFKRILELSFEYATEFYLEFRGESDRGLVVLGAAKLDLLLLEILHRAMRPHGKKGKDILDNELRDFGSRIKACYQLGFINRRIMNVLDKIRKIRNDFAHTVHCKLESDEYRDRILDLEKQVKEIKPFESCKEMLWRETQKFFQVDPIRFSFEATLFFLSSLLMMRLRLGVTPFHETVLQLGGSSTVAKDKR